MRSRQQETETTQTLAYLSGLQDALGAISYGRHLGAADLPKYVTDRGYLQQALRLLDTVHEQYDERERDRKEIDAQNRLLVRLTGPGPLRRRAKDCRKRLKLAGQALRGRS